MTEDNQNNFPSLWSTELIFFSFVLEIFSFRGWKLQMVPYFYLACSVFSVNFGRMWFIFPMTAYNEMYYFTPLINSALFDEENILINTCNWEIREVIWNNCQLNRDTAIAFLYSIISNPTYWILVKCHQLSQVNYKAILFIQSFRFQHIGKSRNVTYYHKECNLLLQ